MVVFVAMALKQLPIFVSLQLETWISDIFWVSVVVLVGAFGSDPSPQQSQVIIPSGISPDLIIVEPSCHVVKVNMLLTRQP